MEKSRRLRTRPSGYVLAAVLLIAGILAITGTGLLSLSLGGYRRAVYASQEIAARSAAEAGVAHARFALKSWSGGELPSASNQSLPGSDASFSYTVALGTPTGFVIDATGRAGSVTKTIHAHLTGQNSLFCGIALNESALIKTEAKVLRAPGSSGLKLSTNSTASGAVSLEASTITFDGDVVVGPGGNPATVIVGEEVVSGSISAATTPAVFPAVTPPVGLPSRGKLTTSTTVTEDGQYDEIALNGSGDVVTISGHRVIYAGALAIENSARLTVAEGSSLRLYVNGTIHLNTDAMMMSTDDDPTKVLIFGTSSCVNLKIENRFKLCGGLYAPQAAFEFKTGAEIHGAFVCRQLTKMETKSKLYYDDRLLSVETGGGTGGYSVSYWQDN